MSQRRIAAGVLVKHQTYGVGLVYTRDESGLVEVDFGGAEPHRMAASVAANLKVLSEDGLESRLWHNAAVTEAWAKEAPLKLLAAALVDIGESATTPRLRERLEDLVLANVGKRWNSWWEPVKSNFGDSKHFTVKKNKKGSFEAVSLANGVNVDDVPAGPLKAKPKPAKAPVKKSATTKDWEQWLAGKTNGAAPGNRPNKSVFKLLSKWKDEVTASTSLSRVLEGASEWMASGSSSAQVATSWLEAVARASIRLREFSESQANTAVAVETGATLVKLVRITGHDRGSLEWLTRACELDRRPDEWRMATLAGIWATIRESAEAGTALLRVMSGPWGRQGQSTLVLDIVMVALKTDRSPQRNVYIDNLLHNIPEPERVHALHSLIIRSSTGEAPKDETSDYVANSRHVSSAPDAEDQLGLWIMASMLLSDGRGQVVEQASEGMARAITLTGAGHTGFWGLLRGLRYRDKELAANHAREIDGQRQDYEAKLRESQREQERLTDLVKSYAARAASTREESKLDVRSGILTAIGEILEIGYRPGRVAEDKLSDVLQTLVLALRAGEAEPLGEVGDIVSYDPDIHQAKTPISVGASACLLSPGVIVRSEVIGDRLLVKAIVEQRSEVDA